MAARIRKGDRVVVTTGRDKGKTGEVTEVRTSQNRVVVQGVNMVKRHTRPTQASPGGIIKEARFIFRMLPTSTRTAVAPRASATRSRTAKRFGSPVGPARPSTNQGSRDKAEMKRVWKNITMRLFARLSWRNSATRTL